MGDSAEPTAEPNQRAAPEPEPLTAQDEFYHQAVMLEECFAAPDMSPRMKEMLERMRWERTVADTRRRVHRDPRQSA